ncbi:MAG: radical SAM protein [Spirochaetes bacterium]|nr:radical SAM protein [Spirochaetota bacterium]
MDKEKFKNRNKVAETPKYWIRLTRFCNNNCIFCLDKGAQNGSVIDLKTVKAQLREGRKQNIKKLVLSGGEPTVHPDYLAIIKYAGSIGYEGIQTVSNGRMFAYKGFLRKAVANGLTETTFSMHGHNKELYEIQSQIPGSFKQALTGLVNALKTEGLIVNIDIVINKTNYKYLEEIIRFYIKMGVSEFDLMHIVPFGGAWKNRKKIFYDPRLHISCLHRAFALQNEFPWIYLWTNRLPAIYLEGYEELIQNPFKLKDEIRGRKRMLEDYLKNDNLMNCHGSRCKYCFLEMFCRDLIELKRSGILKSMPYPSCIKSKQPDQDPYLWKNFKMDNFLDFYIEKRYFIKSFRCRDCGHNKSCSGMQINYIREHGFKVLKPFKQPVKKRRKPGTGE